MERTNNKVPLQLVDRIEMPKKQVEYIRPQQSANVLFNFMGKLDYLKTILSNKAMIPRYNEEKIDYLGLEDIDRIAFPMTCFCDIYLNKLVPHMTVYGTYGIGIDKKWGIEQGIQPIHYINPKSNMKKEFADVFSNSLELVSNEEESKIQKYSDYLLTNLLFMKPIEGEMFRDEKYIERNFHDEKEWRYIPDVNNANTKLPSIIPLEQMNPTSYISYSNGIKQCRELWLNFEYNIIKYLIVKNDEDREELVEFIMDSLNGDKGEKYRLISKILVFNELKEDW